MTGDTDTGPPRDDSAAQVYLRNHAQLGQHHDRDPAEVARRSRTSPEGEREAEPSVRARSAQRKRENGRRCGRGGGRGRGASRGGLQYPALASKYPPEYTGRSRRGLTRKDRG